MKRLVCVFLPLLLVAGCDFLESQFRLTSGDGSSKYPHEKPVIKDDRVKDTSSLSDTPSVDTVLWVSAVEFPEGYDWRRDSSYGDVSAEIILYRNLERILSVPAGGNPSQDRHHIVDGKLFTECYVSGRTEFRRNGELILYTEGVWTLAGFLGLNGHEYLLLRPMSSCGFVLYRDGETILRNDNGNLCGTFSNPAYASGGSLYADEGKCTFCYWISDDRSGKVWHCVKDGSENVIGELPSGVEAVRMCGGIARYVTGTQGGYRWNGACIWYVGSPVTAGSVTVSDGTEVCATYGHDSGQLHLLSRSDGEVYVSESVELALCRSRQGQVTVCDSDGYTESFPGTWRYVFPSCAALIGDKLLLALTSESSDRLSVVNWGGAEYEIEINGFVTNVSYSIVEK